MKTYLQYLNEKLKPLSIEMVRDMFNKLDGAMKEKDWVVLANKTMAAFAKVVNGDDTIAGAKVSDFQKDQEVKVLKDVKEFWVISNYNDAQVYVEFSCRNAIMPNFVAVQIRAYTPLENGKMDLHEINTEAEIRDNGTVCTPSVTVMKQTSIKVRKNINA